MPAESARNLRILHVIDSGGLYGAERVLLGLARQCTSLGDEVIVATLVSPQDDGDPLGEAAAASGLEHQPFVVPDGFRISVSRQILAFARTRRIDVIHSHGYRANIMLGLVPRRYRPCAMLCTLHGWTATGRLQKLAIYEWLERLVVRGFDRVVAVSEPLLHILSRTVPASRLVRISNGIEVNVVAKHRAAATGHEHHHFNDPPLLLAAGRLSEEKGFDLLVDAVARLRDEGIMVKARIAGAGPMCEAIRQLVAARGLDRQIELLGFCDDLGPLYREADLFVLPSRSEGLPLVLLEAMAHRVPVVATPVGEVPTVLEAGRLGTIARTADAQSLAVAMKYGLARAQGSGGDTQQARDRVLAEYSLESMAAGYRVEYFRAMDTAGMFSMQARQA